MSVLMDILIMVLSTLCNGLFMLFQVMYVPAAYKQQELAYLTEGRTFSESGCTTSTQPWLY